MASSSLYTPDWCDWLHDLVRCRRGGVYERHASGGTLASGHAAAASVGSLVGESTPNQVTGTNDSPSERASERAGG